MYIYRGWLNWPGNAIREEITIVLPRSFDLGEPVCIYWQWNIDKLLNKKTNIEASAVINRVEEGEKKKGFFYSAQYLFSAEMILDPNSITLKMNYRTQSLSTPTTLKLVYSGTPSTCQSPGCLIYIGNLDWDGYAINEMCIIIAPNGLSRGEQIYLYSRWRTTRGSAINHKDYQGPIDSLEETETGTKIGFLVDGSLPFDAVVAKSRETIALTMTHSPFSIESKTIALHMSYPNRYNKKAIGSSTKKALIARYATGGDSTIFDVKNMLTGTLGFKSDDIGMLYYDTQLPDSTRTCTKGQEAPTATRFNRMFTDLIQNTEAGDVRFLYIDAHATGAVNNNKDPTEPGGYVQGWDLAEMDGGKLAETVFHNYIVEIIDKHLHKEAKLTILCSPCAGSGLLDMYLTDPGLLLASSETKLNLKAFNGGYPWDLALLTVSGQQKGCKKRIPTYSEPNEEGDAQQEQARPVTHQNQQSIFNGSYITLEKAVFLERHTARRVRLPQGDL